MIRQFIGLEWKAFFRSASLKMNLAVKIIFGIGIVFYSVMILILGIGAFFGLKDAGMDPLETINRYLIYWWVADLVFRYFLQKNPVMWVRPLLTQNISKDTLTRYLMGKSVVSFFNIYPFFFFLPFSITLLFNGYASIGVIGWHLAIMGIAYFNNFLNLAIDNKDKVFVAVAVLLVGTGALQYFGYLDVTNYTAPVFQALYKLPFLFLVIWSGVYLLYRYDFRFFRQSLYLDDLVQRKVKGADGRSFTWLNRFGLMGTFLKNDLHLILRNKRSKSALWASLILLFYGLLLFSNDFYQHSDWWLVFAGLIVPSGFLFSYGSFVPSWDSAYYPLMMSQNIRYREYIASKWWLMVVATIASMILASFYLFLGTKIYMAILAGGIYSIGVNAYMVLLSGAYTKTPLDLSSGKKPFGDRKAFNFKTLLLVIPQVVLPIFIYYLFSFFFSTAIGFVAIAVTGCIGLLLRNIAFGIIEKIYKEEKYGTILAYKQKG